MPRRKFQPPVLPRPAVGAELARKEHVGESLDEKGKPIRTLNYHSCGTEIFRGARDFNGAFWRATYHATRDGVAIVKCPQCLDELCPEEVTARHPGDPAMKEIPE